MLIFGTRTSKIGIKPLGQNLECPHCKTQNSFTVSTYGKYFHLFWIPFFPLNKMILVECNHCKKTYYDYELPKNIKHKLLRSNQLNPTKRPIWHGCGCLMIAVLVILFIGLGLLGVWDNEGKSVVNTEIKTLLNKDLKKVTSVPSYESDSIAFFLKNCINETIKGIKTDEIKYYTKIAGSKLLVLLKVSDMKKIEKTSRKELLFGVEDCLNKIEFSTSFEYYIGIDGKWNMLLVKTPIAEDLDGKFAQENLLYSFYETKTIQTELTTE